MKVDVFWYSERFVLSVLSSRRTERNCTEPKSKRNVVVLYYESGNFLSNGCCFRRQLKCVIVPLLDKCGKYLSKTERKEKKKEDIE